MGTVPRVIIVGPGAAGKSTLATRLGEITADRTGHALLTARPDRDAVRPVGSDPAPARRARIVDHGRGPRAL
jgi:GTPase SAR1 family protein